MTARDWVDPTGQVDTNAVLADTRRAEQLRRAVVDAAVACRHTTVKNWGLSIKAVNDAVDAYETALREVTG
jgi:hypothetical protein